MIGGMNETDNTTEVEELEEFDGDMPTSATQLTVQINHPPTLNPKELGRRLAKAIRSDKDLLLYHAQTEVYIYDHVDHVYYND